MSRAERRAKQRAAARRKRMVESRERTRTNFLPPRVSRIINLTLVIGLVLGLVGWGVYSVIAGRAAAAKVLKTVNAVNITQHELDTRVRILQFANDLKTVSAETKTDILDTLVDEQLVLAEAAARNLVPTDEDIKGTETQQASALKTLYTSPLRITVARLRYGVSSGDLAGYVRNQVLNKKLYAAVTADTTVTEADIVAFYEQYKETLDAQGLSLQDVRDTLGQEILQQKRSEVYSGFLRTLRSKATVADPE
jgi:hypothetical protein